MAPRRLRWRPLHRHEHPDAAEVSADWTAVPVTNATTSSASIRRISATDTNTKDDWAEGASSWGLPTCDVTAR